MATQAQRIGLAVINEPANATRKAVVKTVEVTITNGAAAGTFSLPTGAKVLNYHLETPVAVPGTPTNTNMRLGSAANGEQYVADVDIKGAGWIQATVVYAGRNPAATVHFTVASSGGTTADQDSTAYIHVEYLPPLAG